ncbi:PspC domain-containing protein [Nonomuraea salmonea]|uniref:PspC domain-containing protein n=1 Tax=Nonomuraea salmonea TaxID=46181 RepID=A0ABV5NF69_9ACTN
MTEAPPRQPAAPPSQLRRSGEGRFLMGVCAGLGRHTGVDPVVFRVAFAVLLLGSGIGLFLYLAAFLLMKEPNGRPGIIEQWTRRDFDAETVLALLTAVLAFGLAINVATVWLDTGSLVVGVFLAVSLLAAHTNGVDLVGLARSMPDRLSRRRSPDWAAFDSAPAGPATDAAPPTTAVRRPSPPSAPTDTPVGPLPENASPETGALGALRDELPHEAAAPDVAAASQGTGTSDTAAAQGATASQGAGAPDEAAPDEAEAPGGTGAPQEREAALRQEGVPVEEAVAEGGDEATRRVGDKPAWNIEGLRQAAAGVRDAAYQARRHRQGQSSAPLPPSGEPATTQHPASHASAPGATADAPGASAGVPDAETSGAGAAGAGAAGAGTSGAGAAGARDWEERLRWREQFEGPVSPEAVTAEHPVPKRPRDYRPDPPTSIDHSQGEPFAPHGPYRPLDPARRAGYSPYDPAFYGRPPMPTHPRRPQRRPQPKSYIGAITVLLAIIIGGIVVAVQARSAAGVSPTIVGGAMLITLGAGLLVAAWWGRGAGLVAGGTTVALIIGVGLMLGGVPKSIGPSDWAPTSVAEAGRLYDVGLGDGRLDLSELVLPPGTKVTFNAAVQAGELEVIVPPTVRVEVHATNKVGDIMIGQSLRGGVDLRINRVLEPEVKPEGKLSTIVLNLKGGLGDMTVRHAA